MKTQLTKIAFVITFGLALCFAQDAPLAVYTYGTKDDGINKSLSNKLLATMVQSGIYVEINDPNSFQDELTNSGKSDLASIIQTAKRHGADYVCAVNITEVFGSHSITARLIKIANSQVVRTGLVDRSLKSLGDLTTVSNELARQLLPHSVAPAPHLAEAVSPAYATHTPQPVAVPPAAFAAPQQNAVQAYAPPMARQNQCARKYNINELLSKIKDNFPTQLKDCSSKLAKDMLTPASFGGKKLEPKSFMIQCPIDGIKKELPEGFPGLDKVIGSLTNFVQGIMNTAMAGGGLDPKKLIGAVANMNVVELLNEVKNLSNNECVVDEPYTPPAAPIPMDDYEESYSGEESGKSAVSFGIRTGINASSTDLISDGEYHSEPIIGMQLGFVLDIALSDWFYFQPGLMYIQKGVRADYYFNNYAGSYFSDYAEVTTHYFEFPLLLSLKLSAFRLNAGPYIGFCTYQDGGSFLKYDDIDAGLSMGLGFDIGKLYIGVFSDIGLIDNVRIYGGLDQDKLTRNVSLGLNVGINL